MAKENKIQITKVKTGDDGIFIGYTRTREKYTDTRTGKSNEPAAPDFYNAMNALRVHAAKILGFTEQQSLRLVPHTVHFSYEIDGRMGASISCNYRTPGDMETNINTPPLKCPRDESEAKTDGCFAEETVKALWALELEARKYLDGKRAQMSLFGEEPGASEVGEEKPPEERPREARAGNFAA